MMIEQCGAFPRWQRSPWVLISLLVLVGVLLAGCAGSSAAVSSDDALFDLPTEGTPVEPPRELTDFTFPSSRAGELSLSDLQGQPVLLYFGYTFCPDICPTTLAEFVQVRRDLGEQADEMAFVFISVDSERDTPAVLQRYLGAFDEQFIGLSGDDATLDEIGGEYGLHYEKREVEGTSADYLIDHTTPSYLIDSAGQLVMIYSYGTPHDVISADLLAMLEEA
jgi:protein SCO1/2